MLLASCTGIDKIDNELKKSGRFDYIINLNAPKQNQRKLLFKLFASEFKNDITEEDYEILADKSHGFVAGDILQVFKVCI